MLIKNQYTTAKWCSRNKNRFVKLGYNFTKMYDKFQVKVEDLMPGATNRVKVICDYCGQEYETPFNTYFQGHKHIDKDSCKKCANKKSMEVFEFLHGVTNPLQLPEINKKQQETCKTRYGTAHVLQNKEILKKKNNTCKKLYGDEIPLRIKKFKNKKENTCLKKYGFKHSTQSKIVQEKMKKTSFERYGCEFPSQTKEIKEKMKQTFQERYGVDYCLQVPKFAQKARVGIMQTLIKNGNIPTSKPQIQIFEMCCDIFGKETVTLNKPLSPFFLDIELKIDNILIDIEYDGTYWHNDPQKDRRRDEVVKSRGYKVLRIRGKQNVPTKEQLIDGVQDLLLTKYSFNCINLDI